MISVDLHAVIGDEDGPEHTAWGDPRVKVVDLIRRSHRPLVEIESNKAEGGVVRFLVDRDVVTLHEAHVRFEVQAVAIAVRSLASDVGHADKAVEIANL